VEFQRLAAGSPRSDVRDRYLAIARHYIALADAEVFSDKMRRKERLEELRREREQSAIARWKQTRVTTDHEAPPRLAEPLNFRVIQGAGKKKSSLLAASSRSLRLAAHLSN